MNVDSALRWASELLQNSNIAEPRREASSLLAFILGRPSSFLIAHPEYELNPQERGRFVEAVSRRAAHEPFQYITGVQEFYGLEFEVTPDVLIPRPETEFLVEAAIEALRGLVNPRFCEIGVGSGCISVAVLTHIAAASAISGDISAAAITVAMRNAVRHGVADRLTLVESDVFDRIEGRFDLVVSNPPYVPKADMPRLQAEVRDHEPRRALSGGRSGIDVIRSIIYRAPEHLRPGGTLLVEIGYDQAAIVAGLFDPAVWARQAFIHDLQQIPRVVSATIREP